MEDVVIGIDLGGTNIKVGVVDAEARVLSKMSIPTEGEKGRDHVLENICGSVEPAM